MCASTTIRLAVWRIGIEVAFRGKGSVVSTQRTEEEVNQLISLEDRS